MANINAVQMSLRGKAGRTILTLGDGEIQAML
jgi:hypothetical protein